MVVTWANKPATPQDAQIIAPKKKGHVMKKLLILTSFIVIACQHVVFATSLGDGHSSQEATVETVLAADKDKSAAIIQRAFRSHRACRHLKTINLPKVIAQNDERQLVAEVEAGCFVPRVSDYKREYPRLHFISSCTIGDDEYYPINYDKTDGHTGHSDQVNFALTQVYSGRTVLYNFGTPGLGSFYQYTSAILERNLNLWIDDALAKGIRVFNFSMRVPDCFEHYNYSPRKGCCSPAIKKILQSKKIGLRKIFLDAMDKLNAQGAVTIWSLGNGNGGHRQLLHKNAYAWRKMQLLERYKDMVILVGGYRGVFTNTVDESYPEYFRKRIICAPNEVMMDGKLIRGTSLAAPMVSAAIARVMQKNPALSAREAATIVLKTAVKVTDDPYVNCTAGLLNVAAAEGLACKPAASIH